MISGPAAAWAVAKKELMEHIRSKRIMIIGGVFFLTFLTAAILGIVIFTGDAGEDLDSGPAIRTVLLFYFSIGLVGGFTFTSVLAIAMSADAVCGEWKDRSLFLLLSKPLSREAMLWGKILAAYLSVVGVFVVASMISLLVMVVALGVPDGESWWRIFAGFGMVLAGLVPFVGVGILCSTLFRSPVGSFIVALVLWFLVFPLIGTIGVFIEIAQQRMPGEEGGIAELFAFLSPSSLIRSAGEIWTGEEGSLGVFGGRAVLDDPVAVLVAMAVHTAVYLGLSFFIVRRRDFA